MLPGPVFAVELLTTARRPRYFALRAFYGLVLLFLFWASYQAFTEARGPYRDYVSPGELAAFARSTFGVFAAAQGVVVLAITPSLVAGTIASEKQRKTLHYLLASSLTSGEIVLGKLFARMLMVFVYLVAAVPFLFLLMLFGGVELELIQVTFAVTASFAFFIASLSIFFSTILRQARSAIAMTYATLIVCMLAPLVTYAASELYPDRLGWLAEAVDFVNPMVNGGILFGMARFGPSRMMSTGVVDAFLLRAVILQGLYSLALLAFATTKLRSIAARQVSKPKPILRLDNRGRASWRVLPKPPIGNDPMLWKERFSSRVGGVAKMLGLLNCLFWSTLVGCLIFDYVWPPLRALLTFDPFPSGANREEFLGGIRALTPWIAGFWLLGTASTAASSIASEREDDTWISLVATDLEGPEILRAKMIGSIVRFRWLGLMLLSLWGLGVFAGAVHPLSFLVATAEMAVFLWFTAALGLRFSLASGSTSKSLALTVGGMLFCNGGYLMCCLPLNVPSVALAQLGIMPMVLVWGLYGHADVVPLPGNYGYWPYYGNSVWSWANQTTTTSVASVVLYGVAAALLTWSSFKRFNVVVDRPRLAYDPAAEPASSSWTRAD